MCILTVLNIVLMCNLMNSYLVGGGGGVKALTMTMTPRNLTHGQWSKNLTMANDILESAPWSMVKMVILWSSFVVRSTVYHFYHRKFVFGSLPWSKLVLFG